jgi:hypothetical protein
MDLYQEINDLITTQFPEHREDYRINLLTELIINKIRVVATDFAQHSRDNTARNLSQLYNEYLGNK